MMLLLQYSGLYIECTSSISYMHSCHDESTKCEKIRISDFSTLVACFCECANNLKLVCTIAYKNVCS